MAVVRHPSPTGPAADIISIGLIATRCGPPGPKPFLIPAAGIRARFSRFRCSQIPGKTIISLGLSAALSDRGITVQTFKKGPDYIDPLWLMLASGRPCYNLDFNTQSHEEIETTYALRGADADLCLAEGNKGLYDGLDLDGGNSNAALAAQLSLPVVLVIDCQGMTRGVAPLVLGYQNFVPTVRIAGIILNKLGGARHESKLRAVLRHYTNVPVVGAVHRDESLSIEERHLGLVPSNEAREALAQIRHIARRIATQIDLDAIIQIAQSAATLGGVSPPLATIPDADIRIGVPRDAAFAFYYQDDLDQLAHCGAEVIFFNTLSDEALPQVDGLFLGGGFPETQMAALEANTALRRDIRRQIEAGLPVYAECGGLMYLSRSIQWRAQQRDMVGVIPADAVMHERPVGRGYTELRETSDMLWPRLSTSDTDDASQTCLSAHEFHYSNLEGLPADQSYGFEVLRGTGIDGQHDGFIYKNVLACYTHQRHTQSNPWVARFTTFVRNHKTSQNLD